MKREKKKDLAVFSLALLRPSEAVGFGYVHCATLDIFGLLTYNAGGRLTGARGPHHFGFATLRRVTSLPRGFGGFSFPLCDYIVSNFLGFVNTFLKIFLIFLVRVAGFEPATFAVSGHCTTHCATRA